jgi:hypothetical protein
MMLGYAHHLDTSITFLCLGEFSLLTSSEGLQWYFMQCQLGQHRMLSWLREFLFLYETGS